MTSLTLFAFVRSRSCPAGAHKSQPRATPPGLARLTPLVAFSRAAVSDPAPKGLVVSPGNALGLLSQKALFNEPQALNGRHNRNGCFALSGLRFSPPAFTSQGVALG